MPNAPASPRTLDDASLVQRIDAKLTALLDSRPLAPALREAMRYAVLAPGKRVRPLLVLRGYEAVGGELNDPILAELPLTAAAAIEMIHAFSLVHDDLPAMDDDDLRRGRPTLHKHTNEATAILAGDALQSLPLEALLTEPADQTDVSPSIRLALARELTTATTDMISGQVYDTVAFPDANSELEQLRTIHRHKTGALLRASARMGAIAGQANPDALEAITRYAQAIGLLFQVIDDLLDATGNADEMGKAVHKDQDAGKLTYPGLLGIDKTKEHAQQLHDEAVEALASLDAERAAPLLALAHRVLTRRH